MFVPAYQISHCQISLRHPFHHSKSYPIDTPSPFPSLKVLSHWQPKQPNTQTRPFQNTKYLIAKYHFVTLSITQIPIPATANQRPIPVTWIWYGRRHVSVVRDRWCSQHSTHISDHERSVRLLTFYDNQLPHSDGTDAALDSGGVERRQCGIRSCVSHESSGGHNGSSHMLSEKDYPLVFLSAITMVCLRRSCLASLSRWRIYGSRVVFASVSTALRPSDRG